MDPEELGEVISTQRYLDGVVRFDGEGPLLELVKLAAGQSWLPHQVDAFSYWNEETGAVSHNSPGPGPRLDELPFAEFDDELMGVLAQPELGIYQARGCYWGRCTYCDFVELYKGSVPYRTRTAKRFVDEMEHQMQRHGVETFSIITESIPPAFAKKMSREIVARELKLRWSSFAMVDDIFKPEIFELMSASGCDHLVIGIETMTDRVLKLVEKAATREKNIRFLKRSRDAGIDLRLNFIPNLPSTTKEESLAALEDFMEYRDCYSSVSVFPFEATRSSQVGREPERFGLRPEDSRGADGQAQFASNHLKAVDTGMTTDDLNEVLEAYRSFSAKIRTERFVSRQAFVTDECVPPKVRLAGAYLNFTSTPEGLDCFNWATNDRILLGPEWGGVIESLQAVSSFRPEEFIKGFIDRPTGEYVYSQLVHYNMLIASPNSLGEDISYPA